MEEASPHNSPCRLSTVLATAPDKLLYLQSPDQTLPALLPHGAAGHEGVGDVAAARVGQQGGQAGPGQTKQAADYLQCNTVNCAMFALSTKL